MNRATSLKRLAGRRPSHATIVAYLALFVALGGSGYAATQLPAPRGAHSAAAKPKPHKPKKKKKSHRRQVRVRCAAVSVVVCRGGPAGPTGPQGPPGVATAVAIQGPAGPPGARGAAAVTFFACVNPGGTLCFNGTSDIASSGVSSVATGPTGQYTVTFPQDVFSCAKVATIGGGPGQIGTAADSNRSAVDVHTYDKNGTPTDSSFYLSLTC